MAALALAGSATRARHLPSDAFVWQLAWRPAVSRAVADGADFATWHVLVAEIFPDRPAALTRPDWSALLARGHHVVPVVRIEGRIDGARVAPLVAEIGAVLAALPASVRGGVEIDHDAATSRLTGYAGFLGALRAALPARERLWITALPTWTASPDFTALAASADRLVLQVHAVDDPRLGLFDAGRALGFTRALARRTGMPFQVALPAYGARVSATADGVSVSAEMPAADAAPGQEIAADPAEVARFVARVQRDPPDGLIGLVWFRLPVAGDGRAWSAATLRHVAGGTPPDGRIAVSTRPGRATGALDIVLGNAGQDDVVLPRTIVLPPHCLAADGLGQYVLEPGRLSLRGAGLLGGGASVLAGWMRCSGDVHAED